MKFINQVLLMIVAGLFLVKGGLGFMVATWRLLLPVAMLIGGYMLFKKVMNTNANLKAGSPDSNTGRFKNRDDAAHANNAVIEICPHCLSEVGSCPKCRKKKFF